MSEEIKSELKPEVNENKCFCKYEFLPRVAAVAIGSFIGVYFALALFFATHVPPMMHHHKCFNKMHHGMMHRPPMPDFKGGKFKPNEFQKDFKAPKEALEQK